MEDELVSEKQLQGLIGKYRLVVPIGASGWKECGNSLLAKKELGASVRCYSKALELGTKDDNALLCVILSNRAQAYLGLNEPVLALLDAEAALASDATHLKSYFRKGRALFELERYEEAKEAFAAAGPGQEKQVQSCEERFREKSEGVYNWNVLLEATSKNEEVSHEVANYFHPALKVQDMGGTKGRGWVVNAAIAAGTLLVMEKAACLVYPSLGFKVRKSLGELMVDALKERMKSHRKIKQAILELHVAPPTVKGQDGFRANPDEYLKQVLMVNGFAWVQSSKVDISQRPQDRGFGVWTQCALINHSCLSNCLYGFVGNLLCIRAANDLAPGDEITISYLSAHDGLLERDAKLLQRGFRCECELCVRQRAVLTPEFESARATVLANLQQEKPIHRELYWLGMIQEAAKVDDFGISLIVSHVVGGISADRSSQFNKSYTEWEEAWKLESSEPKLASVWVELVNACILAIWAAVMMGNVPLAESWAPRLDKALAKFFPQEVVQSVGNYMMANYRLFKQQVNHILHALIYLSQNILLHQPPFRSTLRSSNRNKGQVWGP